MTGVYLSETIEKTNPMHKPSGFRDYFIASLLAATVVVFFSLYLVTRRGYFFDAPVTADLLFVPNKALACAGMTLLALTFLIGPLSRYFDKWDHLLAYRKEIGIVGGFLAVLHAFISYFLLPLVSARLLALLDDGISRLAESFRTHGESHPLEGNALR